MSTVIKKLRKGCQRQPFFFVYSVSILDMEMPRFDSFYGLLFLLVLETVGLQFSGDPHAQLKSGDEGCQGGFFPQFILQIRQLEQDVLIQLQFS